MQSLSQSRQLILWVLFLTLIPPSYGRLFNAIKQPAIIRRRTQSLTPRFDGHVVYFADDDLANAKVELHPVIPLLNMDEIEDFVKSVSCSGFGLTVHLMDSSALETALSAWSDLDSFAILTNHAGCHTEGEHGVWRVQNPLRTKDPLMIKFACKQSSLRNISPRINVELARMVSDSTIGTLLLPRGAEPTATATYDISNTQTATFTYQSPTASATGISSSSDISFSRVNTTLLPPDSSIFNLVPHASVLNDLRLSCLNCTLTGNIELIAGGFVIGEGDMEVLSEFVEEGYLEFKMTGLSAMMDFELAFLPGFALAEFTANLPSIPLGAVAIAGVLEFGPILELPFPISVTLGSPVTLRTGFTLSAPSDVSIYLNMSHPESSFTTGISEITLDALPFNADTKDLSVNLTTGFKPQLVLDAGLNTDIFNASANGLIGVYLDLPQLAATIGMVDNVNEDCNPTISNPQNNLIRIDSSSTYGGGAEWDISAHALGIDYDKGSEVPWLSNTTMLPTQCLRWDPKQSALVKATAPATSQPSGQTSGSSGNSPKNAANRDAPASRLLFTALASIALSVLYTF